VIKSKTCSMGWLIWMLLQIRVIHTFLWALAGNQPVFYLAANLHGEPDRS
jgi:hypothetical protein